MTYYTPLVTYIVKTVLYHYGGSDDLPRWVDRQPFMVDAAQGVLRDLVANSECLCEGSVPQQSPFLVVMLASGRAKDGVIKNHHIDTPTEEKALMMTTEVLSLVETIAETEDPTERQAMIKAVDSILATTQFPEAT